jgi:hypothetical protein
MDCLRLGSSFHGSSRSKDRSGIDDHASIAGNSHKSYVNESLGSDTAQEDAWTTRLSLSDGFTFHDDGIQAVATPSLSQEGSGRRIPQE